MPTANWMKNEQNFVADSRYLTDVRTERSGLHEGRPFSHFLKNPLICSRYKAQVKVSSVTLYTNYFTSIFATERHIQETVNSKANTELAAVCQVGDWMIFLAKKCKAINIKTHKTCLNTHLRASANSAVCTTTEGQISNSHRGGRPKSRMFQHIKSKLT